MRLYLKYCVCFGALCNKKSWIWDSGVCPEKGSVSVMVWNTSLMGSG